MKEEVHMFQGLRRDNHQIKQKPEFLWDAHNIRLTNRDDSTLLSITNERGTLYTGVTLKEYYVGHYVLGKYLVVFTANDDSSDNYIYRVEKVATGYKTIILFHGEIGLNPNSPIEAIGIYETELIQKVYWVDGINQPRVINIAKPELKLPKYIDTGDNKKQELLIDGVNLSGPSYSQNPDVDQYLLNSIPNGLYLKESFDFVRTLQLQEQVEVNKVYGLGEFSPGTIQYAFSYYNKYEQESNICYTTPLYYISPKERGGSPEEKVACSFKIYVLNPDTNFEYIRIYSIHRTSIDATPTVKIVEDVPVLSSEEVSYTDTGTTGSTIDPTQLLYIGGESLVTNCITHKDGTLFLGNLHQDNTLFDKIKELFNDGLTTELDDWTIDCTPSSLSTSSVFYDYTPDLSNSYSGAFKYGETYRLGVQVQYDNGKWSEPIFITDGIINTRPVWDTYPKKDSKAIRLIEPSNTSTGKPSPSKVLLNSHVKRIRACVVFPRTYERDIICQGVLCPTVFGVAGRRSDSPYAMSSWFFRPATSKIDNTSDVYHGASIQFKHNYSLFTGGDRGSEIQNMLVGADTLNVVTSDNVDKYNSHFFVDENIVTFHSPDIEFDTNLANTDYLGTSLNIIGVVKLGAISGDIDIQTSSPTISADSPGFIHDTIGYQTKNNKYINGGLISNPFYKDYSVKTDFTTLSDSYWMVYPWHRSGSLNNDSRRPSDSKSTQSAVLSKKKISNLKFFDKNESLDEILRYNISTPQLFMSNELSVVKISPSYLKKEVPYMGNVDTLITAGEEYPMYYGNTFGGSIVDTIHGELIQYTTDPVRMKYKSSPHLVFSLGDKYNEIQLLPRHASMATQNGNFVFPDWQQTGSSDGSNDDKGKYDALLLFYLDGDLIHRVVPNKSYIGTYSIGTDTNGSIYLARTDKASTSTGAKWILLNNTQMKGLVLKAKANFTYVESNNLDGTTDEDYYSLRGLRKYIGKDRYYRFDFFDEDFAVYGTLTDITDSITTSNEASRASGPINYTLEQSSFGNMNDPNGGYPYLLIGELVRHNNDDARFGGKSEGAKRQNLWIPAGRPVNIPENYSGDIVIPFEWGDTWYSRYDCLKTYPFTQEDENSIIEIGSFMCETRINIDGRYDRNRGQTSNINMTPQNFNLLNEAYSQKDNFFNYRILDEYYHKQDKFVNQITWSKEKHAGEDTDTWTNITLANTLDLDGGKGEITALRVFNESLICFQEKATNQILFNSRVQIPVTDGVPVEISNGYKVDGSRFISDSIGCQNKWTSVCTPLGIYFIDNYTNTIWLYNGQLTNISDTLGMKWWLQDNHSNKTWNPIGWGPNVINGIRTFYDPLYKDVYFTPGPDYDSDRDVICYSEGLAQFTSQMSYGGTQAMFQFGDSFCSLRNKEGNLELYENFKGKYNDFFGTIKGWDFSFISNDNPTYTKIFDTVELRTDHWLSNDNNHLLNTFPMNYIEVSNEYQRAYADIDKNNMRKKFRMWRGLIPRASFISEGGNEITRKYGRARIRNPWSMIKMGWNPKEASAIDKNNKVVIHDVSVKYTI